MKKKKKNNKRIIIFSLTALFFLLLISYLAFIFTVGKNSFSSIINNQPQKFAKNFNCWKKLTPFLRNFNQLLADFVGQNENRTYLVLLQNNYELRPSGGFMGSYAKLKFEKAGLVEFLVEDIYVPDGQLTTHVEPPWPIQTAFQQGFWKLRDSNWEPDFPTAVETINWFFEKGGEEKTDGIMALNFLVIKDIVKIFEPIILTDYNQPIKADDFYQITQKHTERDFFPGSRQKKDFLTALNNQLMFKIKNANFIQLLQLIKALKNNLAEKQILFNFGNPGLQQYVTDQNWDGGLKRKFQDSDKYIADYLYIVDTNLGSNKANLYIQRQVDQELNFENNVLKNKITIDYFNQSFQERPNYEDFWGGLYENFLRVLVPLEAENIEIKINGQLLQNRIEIKEYKDKKIKSIGFFVEVPPLSEIQIEIKYEKKANINRIAPVGYLLEIQKQPGIVSYPHIIKISSQNLETTKIVKTDSVLKFKLKRVNLR